MKVLIVHNSYQQAGGEDAVVAQETDLLRRGGVQVVTYVRTNKELAKYGPMRRMALPLQLVWAADANRDVSRLLEREHPDIVHVHNTFLMISPSVYWACHQTGVPVVQTLHNFRLLCPAATFFRQGHVCDACAGRSLWPSVQHGCYRSRGATLALASAITLHRKFGSWSQMVDCYIALTEFSRCKFVQNGLPPEKVLVKSNFVYPDPGARDRVGDYGLFVGRLSEEKGVLRLIRAWNSLRSSPPLLIAGDGPLRQQLQAEAGETIRFVGSVARRRVMQLIKGARFVLVPSECYENFPMAIAEAYACGVPVIASAHGAMQELVQHERTGLLFETGNIAALADTISRAWADLRGSRAMGAEARRQYETRYTAEQNYPMLMNVYASAQHSITLAARMYVGPSRAA